MIELLDNQTEVLIENMDIRSMVVNIVTYDDLESLTKDIESQSLYVGVVIPQNFTEFILKTYNSQYNKTNGVPVDGLPKGEGNSSVTLLGDPSVSNYQISSSVFMFQ